MGYRSFQSLNVGDGYKGNTPPTNGAIIEGSVGIGINNPSSSLHVVDTDLSSSQSGIRIEDTGTGDPILHLENPSTEYIMGIDSSDDDKLIIGGGPTPGTLPMIVATIDGEVTFPLQPAFGAFQESMANNVTGNSTIYTLGTTVDLTEIFDQNSDFDPTTGVFTAPVTGRYRFEYNVHCGGLTASFTSGETRLITSNKEYFASGMNAGVIRNLGNLASFPGSFLVDMDAADTANVTVTISGSSLTVDIYGEASVAVTRFSGNLVC